MALHQDVVCIKRQQLTFVIVVEVQKPRQERLRDLLCSHSSLQNCHEFCFGLNVSEPPKPGRRHLGYACGGGPAFCARSRGKRTSGLDGCPPAGDSPPCQRQRSVLMCADGWKGAAVQGKHAEHHFSASNGHKWCTGSAPLPCSKFVLKSRIFQAVPNKPKKFVGNACVRAQSLSLKSAKPFWPVAFGSELEASIGRGVVVGKAALKLRKLAIAANQCDRRCEGSKMQPVSVQESLLVAFSPKLEYLATASRDGRLKAFDTGNTAPARLGGGALRWLHCAFLY